jgi:RNA polymerase sigma-70 factor (ECF subfamily)
MPHTLDIDALYERHREGLLRYFARRTADAEIALDLWAETFAQAVKGRRRYRGSSEENEAAWLYAIARNLLNAYLRKGYAEQRAVRKLGIERPPVTDELLRDVERRAGMDDVREEIAHALATLSDDTRAAVQMRVVEERSYADVAETLSLTEVAARARVSRGLQALADILDPTLLSEVSS